MERRTTGKREAATRKQRHPASGRARHPAVGRRQAPAGKRELRAVQHAFEEWQKDKRLERLRPLVLALGSRHPDTRHAAMYALSAAGPPASRLLVTALSQDAALRPALRLLREIGTPQARKPVERLMGHTDHTVRQLAFRALLGLGREPAPEDMWSRQVSATGQVASLTTVIHGTWAEDETWWRWPSDFPQYLDSLTRDVYKGTDQFQWPGDNTPEARGKGATALIEWLGAHPAQRVTLIAHSHGGNVVFKASEHGVIHIDRLILLGTPIRDDYAPNLARVGKIVNVYSEDDAVQWFGTWTPDLENHARDGGRTLPDGPQVTNREVATATDNPHSELHTVALWKREGLGSLLTEP